MYSLSENIVFKDSNGDSHGSRMHSQHVWELKKKKNTNMFLWILHTSSAYSAAVLYWNAWHLKWHLQGPNQHGQLI